MISLFKSKPEEKKQIMDFKDPFQKTCIESISTHCFRGYDRNVVNISGRVKFINGNTKGEQEFTAEDFPSLVKKMDDFINSL